MTNIRQHVMLQLASEAPVGGSQFEPVEEEGREEKRQGKEVQRGTMFRFEYISLYSLDTHSIP